MPESTVSTALSLRFNGDSWYIYHYWLYHVHPKITSLQHSLIFATFFFHHVICHFSSGKENRIRHGCTEGVCSIIPFWRGVACSHQEDWEGVFVHWAEEVMNYNNKYIVSNLLYNV